MGQKVNPISFRTNINKPWKSRWFNMKNYRDFLKEDVEIRENIKKQMKGSGIKEVEIERSANTIRIIIYTSKPGVIIGRAGAGVNVLRDKIKNKVNQGSKAKIDVNLEVKEIRHFEESAALVAQHVAEQIEKRISFRKALKSTIEQVMKRPEVKGVKIMVGGRLNGADMSRKEWLSKGGIPLHTIRADIGFAKATANTTYGSIGVKVWLYRGEVMPEKEEN